MLYDKVIIDQQIKMISKGQLIETSYCGQFDNVVKEGELWNYLQNHHDRSIQICWMR